MRAAVGFRCRRCGKVPRLTYLIERKANDDLTYRSRICKLCATYLVRSVSVNILAGQWIGHWDGRTLRRIAAL